MVSVLVTRSVKLWVPVLPLASRTSTVKEAVPVVVGVPVIASPLSCRPVGSAPATSWKVKGALPPAGWSVSE
jgi:hypothetical protein